ncbi:oocyte zinc finger -like [Pelobates cultripes]|uniref:Oocyte zinc finger -like n=1 Tax=Pelobates cultripes TaxID=61616 RepID=A0AAD1T7L8_PELCU|nr:oocyte zinc finger -like [Pelobates cultripes]
MKKNRNQVAAKILDLTMEIICLLTGEDHIIVKSSDGKDLHSFNTQGPSMLPLTCSKMCGRLNDKKILELTNKIILLLTGEVPIRCEDVAVYFSMEEWEYLEGHSDRCKDITIENRQPHESLEKCEFGGLQTVSKPDDETPNGGKSPKFNTAGKSQSTSVMYVLQNSQPCGKGNPTGNNMYISTDHPQTDYPSHSKEESGSCEEEYLTDIYTPIDYPNNHIKEEPDSHEEGNLPLTITPRISLIRSSKPDKCINDESDKSPKRKSNTDPIFDCTYCPQSFNNNTELVKLQSVDKENKMAASDTGKQQFSGSECGNKCITKANIINPKKSHTGEKPFQCIECGKMFTRRTHLASHVMIHTGEKPFKCTDCGKCFILKATLTRHQMIHIGEKPFKCTDCGKCFILKATLTRHQMIHVGEKPFKCAECGKCFTHKYDLIRHNKIHTGEKPFNCTECGKCFTQASNLASHVMIHTAEKTFKCSECGKRFNLKSTLNKHQMIHTSEKPFKCSECGKCFILKSTLTRHQMIHKGDKPFKCIDCGKCFSQSSRLKSHKKIHTGEKTFKCPECGKHFTQKYDLMRHHKIHTREKPFTCTDCGKCFTQAANLALHLRKKHFVLPSGVSITSS